MDTDYLKNYNELLVIADFDKTFTKAYIDGKEVESIKSIISIKKILGDDYNAENREIFNKYSPIERNYEIDSSTKLKSMDEWWEESYKLLIKYKLSKKHLEEIIEDENIRLRDGVDEFLKELSNNQIPIIFISASGIGEVIPLIFQKYSLLFANQYFIVNRFVWNDQNELKEAVKPYINSMNKSNLSYLINKLPKNVITKKNIMLLGDSLDDIQMGRNFDYEKIFKIGFTNKTSEAKYLDKYLENFDLVIQNDGGFGQVTELVFG